MLNYVINDLNHCFFIQDQLKQPDLYVDVYICITYGFGNAMGSNDYLVEMNLADRAGHTLYTDKRKWIKTMAEVLDWIRGAQMVHSTRIFKKRLPFIPVVFMNYAVRDQFEYQGNDTYPRVMVNHPEDDLEMQLMLEFT